MSNLQQTVLYRRPPRVTGAPRILGIVLALAAALLAGDGFAQSVAERQSFDGRIQQNATVDVAPSATQLEDEHAMRRDMQDLAVDYDRLSGAVRNLRNHSGYLSDPNPGADHQAIAQAFVNDHLSLLGLTADDLRHSETDQVVYSQVSGSTHVYLRQVYNGIPVYNAQLHINVNQDGRIVGLNNSFVPNLAASINSSRPSIGAGEAIAAAADHLEIPLSQTPTQLDSASDPQQTQRLKASELSSDDITAELFWLPVAPNQTRLMWNLKVQTKDQLHAYDINVDATTRQVWTRFDRVSSSEFRVYDQPTESPQHTVPLPPSDARDLVIDPEDATASPSGWFNAGTTHLEGNNVHACADTNANNVCDAGEPSCGGSLICDFPVNLSQPPSVSKPAAVTNLFYWNNLIHDIQYKYGFDEAAGNFQESNFGRGGLGSDSINADAQDGSGSCNANFLTLPDGFNPRMQMFNCGTRDGDFDNGVIVHEYGHGIAIRQVGGPANVSCLNNAQQPGEGWSDWFGLVYTAKIGDQGDDARGIGSYLFSLPANGGGIRELPYSTDPAINNWTYASIAGASVPHGVGSRWGQVLWEVYWALVDERGFDPDLLNPGSFNAGNQRALLYVNEGLKNTACSPTFIDARDGIIQAATNLFNGEDVCTVWQAFAGFGLGTDASTPAPTRPRQPTALASLAAANSANRHPPPMPGPIRPSAPVTR